MSESMSINIMVSRSNSEPSIYKIISETPIPPFFNTDTVMKIASNLETRDFIHIKTL